MNGDLTTLLAFKELVSDFNRHAHGMIVPPPMTEEDRLVGTVRALLQLGVSRQEIRRIVDEACVADVMDS